MKLLISTFLICFAFTTSASVVTEVKSEKAVIESNAYPGPGKPSGKEKRVNKKRKRRCAKFSRKGFAG